MTSRLSWFLSGALLLLPSSNSCWAALYVGSLAPRSAEADFTLSGTTLTIVLKNTSTANYSTNEAVPSDLLTGLFVDIDPTPNPFTLVSATPSQLLNWNPEDGTAPTNLAVWVDDDNNITGTVGGWQLKPEIGVGTAGFGIGNFEGFDGNAVNGGPGFAYGIINAGYAYPEGNNPVNTNPLVRDTLTFTITVGSNFSLSHIKSVEFQYGTSLTDPNFPGNPPAVPEPATIATAISGLIPLGFIGLRRLRRRRLEAREA